MLGIQRAKFGVPRSPGSPASRIPALPGFVGEKPVASDRSWHAAQGQRVNDGWLLLKGTAIDWNCSHDLR